MAIHAHTLAEPIPGYKLLERLGTGGFGEVWKCEAPGGLIKAIKIVHGSLQHVDGGEIHAQQELKALNRVKTVRHPYILSLERYDIINGQLLIVMELADRSLWDRFKECRSQGLIGIPRDELLRYMEETAEALDLMKDQYQLQHLDIKPQNIFLVHNHVKVADFGLVKDLEGMKAHVTSGVTPVYAAPETFDGLVSSYCDQYSLAIVYQELLTGQRPFAGTNIRQLLMQHMTGTPDLTPLPSNDRPAVARSLAKKPEERFPSCAELVKMLRSAAVSENADGAAGTRPSWAVTTPANDIPRRSAGTRHDLFLPPSVERLTPSKNPFPEPAAPANTQSLRQAKSEIVRARSSETTDLTMTQPRRPPRVEMTGDGVLFPALVVSLGHTGLGVLQQLRKSLRERWGSVELQHIRMVHIDTDPNMLRHATHGEPGVVLSNNEVYLARLNRPVHYLKPARGRPHPETWLSSKMLYRIPKEQNSTEGIRALGRLAFIDHYSAISTRLKNELDACTNAAALAVAKQKTLLGMRTNRPRVYVVAGLAGGTGSGMYLDLAYVMRNLLRGTGWTNPDVVGLLLLPTTEARSTNEVAAANAFAALTELHHFSAPDTFFKGHYDEGEWAVNDKDPPFNRCHLLPLPTEIQGPAATRRVLAMAGDFICRDLTSPLGRIADEHRAGAAGTDAQAGPACHAFGLNWLAWPRQALLHKVGQRLCHQLAQTWTAPAQPGLRDFVQAWVTEQWHRHELGLESLVAQLQATCQRKLGQAPEAAVDAALKVPGGKGLSSANLDPNEVVQVIEQLNKLVGRPEEERPSIPLVKALDEALAYLTDQCDRKLAEMAVCMIDLPSYHLAGAEEAICYVGKTMQQILESQKAVCQGLRTQSADLYKHIHSLLQDFQKSSGWFGRKGKIAAELLEALRAYPRVRYQGLVLQRVLTIYQQLTTASAEHLKEVGFCRGRLADLVKLFQDPPGAARAKAEQDVGQYLLPDDCATVSEAAQKVCSDISPRELLDLDQVIQNAVQQKFKSLINVCMGKTDDVLKDLAALMRRQAEEFVKARLGGSDVVEIYLDKRQSDEQVVSDIAGLFSQAAPEFGDAHESAGDEVCIVATPLGAAGDHFRNLARQALPGVEVVPAPALDEIVLYREQTHLPLAELPQLGPQAQSAYQKMAGIDNFTPHCRTDVPEWKPLQP